MLSKPIRSNQRTRRVSSSSRSRYGGLDNAYNYDSSNESIPLWYTDQDIRETILEELEKEAQGRSRQTYARRKTLGRAYSKLPEGVVWEFGKQVNLEVEAEVSDYLHHLDEWFKGLKKPKTLGSCQAKIDTFLKYPHRHLGLLLLAQAGNRMAMLFLAVRRGMEQEQYDNFSLIEAQFFGVGEILLLSVLFVTIFGAYANRSKLARVLSNVMTFARGVDSLSEALNDTISSVSDKCETVKRWINASYSKFKEVFKKLAAVFVPFAQLALLFTVIVVAMKAIETLASFVVHQMVDFLIATFKIPMRIKEWISPQAQSGDSKGFLPEFLSSMYEYMFNDVSDTFLEYLGPLPKVVSIAKAIEWMYEKFTKVMTCAMEAYTGELQGKTALEMSISSFRDEVSDFVHAVASATATELTSSKLAQMDAALDGKKRLLTVRVVTCNTLRPSFISHFNIAGSEFDKARAEYQMKLGQGHKRPIPVWLFIHGKPGVGKSMAFESICQSVWQYVRQYGPKGIFEKEEFDYNQVFTFNQGDEYYDGYTGQPIVLIDDFFQVTDTNVRMATSGTLINMCSPTPYSLLVATPAMKAHTYFTSRLIISTANIEPDFNGQATGLKDFTALRDRVTLGVEMMKGDPRFWITAGEVSTAQEATKADKTTRKYLEMDQLVAVVGEMLIERESQHHSREEVVSVPRFVGSVKSARFSMDRVLEIQDDEKGKEKVPDDAHTQGGVANMRRFARNAHERVAYVLNGLPEVARNIVEEHLPHYFLPMVEVSDGFVEDYESWIQNRLSVTYAISHHGNVPTQRQYLMMLQDPPKGSFYTMFFAGCAVAGLAALAVWKMIQMCMPGTAHDRVAQTKVYDSQAPGRKRPGREERGQPIRAGAGQRAWRRDYNASFWNHAQGGENVVRSLVNENTVTVEMRKGCAGESWLEIKERSPECATWGLFVCSNYLLLPNHLLFGKATMEDEIFITLGRGENTTFNLRDAKEYQELDGDLAVIAVPNVRMRRNILGHFADDVPKSGRIEHLLADQVKTLMVAEQASSWENKISVIPVNSEYGAFETDLRLYGVRNETGMCGSVYVHQGTNKIVAIHMGGSPSAMTAYATIVLKSDLERLVKPIEIVPPFEPALEETTVQGGIQTVGLLSPKMGAFIPGNTNLKKTLFDLDGLPFERTTDQPAHLKRFTHDGVVVDPIVNHFKEKLAHVEAYPWASPLDSFKGFLPKTFDISNVRVITIEEAIYGIPGQLKPMDRNTSVGYFYKKMGLKRCNLFGPPRNEDGTYGPRHEAEAYIHPVLRRDVEHKLELFRRGAVVPVVFEMFMKDELRPKEKVEKGNTRAIDPMDLASLIVQRMVLGTLIEEAMKDPVNSPIALAINPHSSQWGLLYGRHRGDGSRRVGAGDFSGFDMNIPNVIRDDFIRFVRQVHPEPGLAEVVILANFQGWHICGRLLFYKYMGNSSGSLITAFFNCFANWWIHKQAWLTKYKEEDFHWLELSFVGDDSVFSVPKKFREYDMELISKFCREYLHMTYTSPTKDQNMHCSWEDLIFLKRRFVETRDGIMGPLAQGSLSNMVAWCECDPRDGEVMESTIRSLMVETYHYGRDVYRQVEAWARRETRRLGFLSDIPDWTSMYNSRRKDYAVGTGCIACEKASCSGLMGGVLLASWACMAFLPVKWSIGFACPIIEEVARTFSCNFTQEVIHTETVAWKAKIAGLNAFQRPYVKKIRGLVNHFHEVAGAVAQLHPLGSLFARCEAHVKMNQFSLRHSNTDLVFLSAQTKKRMDNWTRSMACW